MEGGNNQLILPNKKNIINKQKKKKGGSLPKRDQIEKHWVRGAGSIGTRGNPSCSLFSRQGLVYWL